MNFTPITTPKVVKALFPTLTWNISTSKKDMYLTFDDGPTPEITHWVLETLKQFNAKATFFCIGKNVEQHSNIFQQIVKDGHGIGNHTYNHVKGWKTKTKDYLDEIVLCEKAFKTQNYKSEKLFRPPYGQIHPKQINKLQEQAYKIVMWNVLSIDWDNSLTEEICLKNVVNHAKSGSIIVLHDSVKASKNMKYILPKILEYFTEKGFTFKRIPG
ncbi:polysaccharide deacetylase family protein [Pontimicrobium sp. SW4]|uniref:Polysaccharide deacetylase family protein n=1 Tax=Pontimicrobium sp. SW4 TaxID=3153519 RepID=A0AAU7BRR8_9FLAO